MPWLNITSIYSCNSNYLQSSRKVLVWIISSFNINYKKVIQVLFFTVMNMLSVNTCIHANLLLKLPLQHPYFILFNLLIAMSPPLVLVLVCFGCVLELAFANRIIDLFVLSVWKQSPKKRWIKLIITANVNLLLIRYAYFTVTRFRQTRRPQLANLWILILFQLYVDTMRADFFTSWWM